MSNITIPRPLHIVLDDMGWMSGKDDRANGGPSRLGINRKPCYKDYLAINELGKRLGMKISCAFVLGEWDPDNRLRSVKNLSKYKDGWNNAAYLNKEELVKCAGIINESEYIDLTVHGLLHGYYMDGTDNTDESDFYYRKNDKLYMVSEQEIRHRLDCFFDLLEFYGINKKVNAFVPPSFSYRFNEISSILKDYGIKYVSTIFSNMETDEEQSIVGIEENGIINIDRNINDVEWDEFGSELSALPANTNGILGVHWPNLLHQDADKNSEVIDKAVEFFNNCSNNFGTIISRDIEFCANQSLFYRFAKTYEENGAIIIDISGVPKGREFYISSKEPITSVLGAEISVFERKQNFITYKLSPSLKIVTIK